MQHNELLLFLKNYIKVTPKQKDIAAALNVKTNVIGTRASRNSVYTVEEILKIGECFNIHKEEILKAMIVDFAVKNNFNLSNLCNYKKNLITENKNDYFEAALYSDKIGEFINGVFVFSKERETVSILKNFVFNYNGKKSYFIIKSNGEGMTPTINSNDLLIFEHFEPENNIQDNNIYIFNYNNKIFIKRLIQNINQIAVLSDNPNKEVYPLQHITSENTRNFSVIGKMAGLIRNFNL